ncbi:MET [Bugula neritina]|uniref:MET n=1 Tax=Bugula neritina TaxID=10212 RepID=A0A7J7J680_BUGNE|nr:MET [Bugula neritina]
MVLLLFCVKGDKQWFASVDIDLKAKLDSLLIQSDALKIKEGAPIGQGNFGTIYLGQMCSGESVKTVAVKTLKGNLNTLKSISVGTST